MSSFFEVPPSPSEPGRTAPPRPRRFGWQGAPLGAVPGVVPVEQVLVATDDVAVAVTALEVYTDGLAFDVVAMSSLGPRGDGAGRVDPMQFHHHALPESNGIPHSMLRVGVEFSDGRKATNMADSHPGRPVGDAIVLRPGGGGGSDDRYAQSFWVWPLPPDGAMRIVVEWPAFGIPVTAIDVDGSSVLAAAGRSRVVFSDDHLPEPPGPDADGRGWAAYS